MADIVAIADYTVEIDGEKYPLTKVPEPTSKVVQGEVRSILDDINLADLNDGLKRSGSLLYLAFNGVAGVGALRADINKLQDDLAVQCGKTSLALGRFSRSTTTVLETVQDVFGYLIDGSEETAVLLLKDSGDVAADMSKEALELATGFEKLADATMAASGKTQIAQSASDTEIENLKKQHNDLKAKTAKAKSLSEGLAESRKKLEKLYTEAKEKADQASERGFAVQMVGAILGPIAQGLGSIGGAFVAAKTGGLAGGGGGGAAPPAAPVADSAEQTAAKKKLADENAKEADAKKEVTEAEDKQKTADEDKTKAIEAATKKDTESTLAKEKAEKKPDDAELKAAAAKAAKDADDAQKAKVKAEEVAKEAAATLARKKANWEAAGKAVAGAQEAFNTAAKNLQSVGAGLLDLAKAYEEEKRNYLKIILDYEKQGIDALAEIAEYAVRMSAVVDSTAVTRMASESLLQAIKALNTVAQVLRDAAKFWTQMKQACDALAKPDFLKRIETFSKLRADKRSAAWKSDSFKRMAVMLMAKWQALHVVLEQASQSVSETRKGIQANITSSPSPEESLKLVPGLAKTLSISASRAKDVAESKVKELEKETAKAA